MTIKLTETIQQAIIISALSYKKLSLTLRDNDLEYRK